MSFHQYLMAMLAAVAICSTMPLLMLFSATSSPALRAFTVTIAVCGVDELDKVIAPEGYDVVYAHSCDEAYLYGTDWVVQCFADQCDPIVLRDILKNRLVNGFCTHEWGVAAFGHQVKCVRPTKSPTRSPTTYPVSNIPLNPSWRHCERPVCQLDGECALLVAERSNTTAERCCSDVLYQYLVEMHDIIQSIDKEHFIMYGTLLGAVRDQDIIPWETDVDIVLTSYTYDQWRTWKSKLGERGFILFESTILRVCKLGHTVANNNQPPWKTWFPYVDIYRMTTMNGYVKTNQGGRKYPSNIILPTSQCTIRNKKFPCAARPVEFLRTFYGNWKHPKPDHHNWRPKALPVPLKMVSLDDPIYKVVYALFDAFEKNGVPACLILGSFLGAERHAGVIPFGEKDADIALFSTNTSLIEEIIDDVAGSTMWHRNTDGKGPGSDGFGYHVGERYVAGSSERYIAGSNYYIDIWLYEQQGSAVKCVGHHGGCVRWMRKYRNNPKWYNFDFDDFFPFRYLKFGSRELPVPRTTQFLQTWYPKWQSKCGYKGQSECSDLMSVYKFADY